MKITDYHRFVQVPANVAVAAMRHNGLPVSLDRAKRRMDLWDAELKEMERYVESEAAKRGFTLKYSPAHSAKPDAALRDLLFSSRGLGLESVKRTASGEKDSTDDDALLEYAAVGPNHREDDHPVVYAILKIRSVSKARGTHLAGLIRWRRADGCCHPKYKWGLSRTTRLSAEDPAVHQLPEKKDPETARLVKECLVPREKPWLGDPDDWDPRRHGWVARVDVKGAEAVIRSGCYARCRVSSPYLREGKDIHGKAASIFYAVPDGTYKKGQPERDSVGKQGYFCLIYGGEWKTFRETIWQKARVWMADVEAKEKHARFFAGFPDLRARYLQDTLLAFDRGYIEDAYGRRWNMLPPEGVRLLSREARNGDLPFDVPSGAWSSLKHVRNCYANRAAQSDQGSTTLWCVALCHEGEYVELRVPPCWGRLGVPYPEAAEWQLNGGAGPGCGALRAWMINTVHDSLWMDGAPGHLVPAMKVAHRRFMGVPADFLLEADMPWRVEMEVGPDLGHLRSYADVAKHFDLEPPPDWY